MHYDNKCIDTITWICGLFVSNKHVVCDSKKYEIFHKIEELIMIKYIL